MENVEIRKAAPKDAADICELNRTELGYEHSLSGPQSQLELLLDNPEHCIYVATLEGGVVGYIHAGNYNLLYHAPVKNILGIAVSGKHKRKGIGKMLLFAIEAWAAQSGAAGVRLVSGSSRASAHRFYLACGYTKNKEQFNFSKPLA